MTGLTGPTGAPGGAGRVDPHGQADLVWQPVCGVADLAVERGAAALVGGRQVALFRLTDDRVLAVQQLDPFSGANVMSRGIVGTRRGVPTVASPMYKQVFALETGECLDPVGFLPVLAAGPDLATWPVEVRDGVVNLAVPTGPTLADPTPTGPTP
ncbi:nitrite reductase small subunit NirD [Oerskovia turbata]|uniref:Nitrite reductase small subunit NirD n=2 Tax=Oerskovia turbata TaxID=1713 RepID=A0A4Q1KUW3_9CELL|nr:nitrite reductase small subunit NirD [Oerskovia turbata]RXR34013.1 nitrite reductase small subunit NirD [Oerskovia turbata]TGJ95825.1 nitrite reductase (NAD(P)H) small subunit [Actinotalea fermentans ATCC 43279 = JCM 9966 = DSM 3133]